MNIKASSIPKLKKRICKHLQNYNNNPSNKLINKMKVIMKMSWKTHKQSVKSICIKYNLRKPNKKYAVVKAKNLPDYKN